MNPLSALGIGMPMPSLSLGFGAGPSYGGTAVSSTGSVSFQDGSFQVGAPGSSLSATDNQTATPLTTPGIPSTSASGGLSLTLIAVLGLCAYLLLHH